MSQIPTAHAVWTTSKMEALIEWLEESENLRKTKKGSRVSKKQIIKEVAGKIPTEPEVKVSYKYDNLLKSYHEAVKHNNSQSGSGLSMRDLDEGKKNTLRIEKLLSQCLFFFRLEAIFGDRLSIRPPIHYDSSVSKEEAVAAVEGLLTAIGQEEEEVSLYELDVREEAETEGYTWEKELLPDSSQREDERGSQDREENGERNQEGRPVGRNRSSGKNAREPIGLTEQERGGLRTREREAHNITSTVVSDRQAVQSNMSST
ncbi:hypothetical protein L873DRAFT_1845858 [Choiromyces venosus 120613-1]|uniref:Uncharacterized protein n=1 Tax=Choiromyces venosus 120613-1 TaxID=1336337 RepID=A0A3N4JBM4_9PEZI|nr:hypothetical protein L873DRAFT_1845858 [Choiromyces venosus 120613-1]